MDPFDLKAKLKRRICFTSGKLCWLLITDFGLLLEVSYEFLWVKNSSLSSSESGLHSESRRVDFKHFIAMKPSSQDLVDFYSILFL